MDIITFSEELQQRLRDEVNSKGEGNVDLMNSARLHRFTRELVDDLKRFTASYSFSGKDEEIRFFKEAKPELLSQYYYHRKLFALTLFDSFRDTKSRLDNYYRTLDKLRRFIQRNKAFYEYCMSGATYLDMNYFTRNRYNAPAPDIDEKFSTGSDTLLAKVLANEMVKDYVMQAIRSLQGRDSTDTALPWTDSKVALVELIYALHAAAVFNHGKANLKQIVQHFEATFNIDLGNYARVYSEIQIRKSGHANFLDRLKERLAADPRDA